MIVVLVGYPLSIGPAHLIECSIDHPYVWRLMDVVYRPLAARFTFDPGNACTYRYADYWDGGVR